MPPQDFSFPTLLFSPGQNCGIYFEPRENESSGIGKSAWGEELGALVQARCTARHVFHEGCLEGGMNLSGMKNNNTCPLDRGMFWEKRGRHLVGDGIWRKLGGGWKGFVVIRGGWMGLRVVLGLLDFWSVRLIQLLVQATVLADLHYRRLVNDCEFN